MIESIVRTCSPTLHITPGPGHPLIFNDDVGDDDDDDGDGDWDSDDNGDGDGDVESTLWMVMVTLMAMVA